MSTCCYRGCPCINYRNADQVVVIALLFGETTWSKVEKITLEILLCGSATEK